MINFHDVIPWNIQTFPKNEVVWIVHNDYPTHHMLVTHIQSMGIHLPGFVPWEILSKKYKRLIEGNSRRPCGTLVQKPEKPDDDQHDITFTDENFEIYPTDKEIRDDFGPLPPIPIRTQKYIKVMQGFLAGETLESRLRDNKSPWKVITHPNWNWQRVDYRIVPKTEKVVYMAWDKNSVPHDIAIRKKTEANNGVWYYMEKVWGDGITIVHPQRKSRRATWTFEHLFEFYECMEDGKIHPCGTRLVDF